MKKVISVCLAAVILLSALFVCAALTGCEEKKAEETQPAVMTVINSGQSMTPTIADEQEVTVVPLNGMPKTGDIILINHTSGYLKPLIKRVIAAEGQELRIDFEKSEVYVDGKKLDEPYIQGQTIKGDIPEEKINGVIPSGKVFVMGDNRKVSLDSRYENIGLIDINDIGGVVELP